MQNININEIEKLPSPSDIKKELVLTNNVSLFIQEFRITIKSILDGKNKKFIIILGPCSIHNINQAITYGKFIVNLQKKYGDKIFFVMRTYLSKPRSCDGWKGFLYDPYLDGTYNIFNGIKQSRYLLLELSKMGIPCSMEILDTISPQYFDDILTWGAIGARTTESQIHRELASAISVPIGFKNNLSGDLTAPINSIICCRKPHHFLGCNDKGEISKIYSKGNLYTHLILRGSSNGPNYYIEYIENAKQKLLEKSLNPTIIVDCSHGNSGKDYTRQIRVAKYLINYHKDIKGIMLESNLVEGKQNIKDLPLKYGVSITDSCINLVETENIIKLYYDSLGNK